MDERAIFFSSVLLLGIAAQWLAWRLKLPSILLLLGFGFTAGLFYDQSRVVNQETLFPLVGLAVGVILVEGGLTLRFSELKEAGSVVTRLIAIGSLVTWGLSTLAAHFLAGFSWPVALLVAGILVVTGPTVIGPLLRAVKPKRSVNSVLKWESIVIDPVGAVLAVLVFGLFWGHGHGEGHGGGWQGVVWSLAKTILIGGGLGYAAARLIAWVISRHWVPDFLQSVFILALTVALFTLSNYFQHESGLLTVTVLGIALANQHRAQIRHVIEFKENLRVILISSLFIVLGARIGIDDLVSVWKEALLFLAALVLVVRPLSVFISTWGAKGFDWRDKVFLSCMAPRGIVAAAVSSVFALDLAEQGGAIAEEAARIVPITYVVIVGTVALYGLSSAPLARWLGVAMKNPQGILFVGIRSWTVDLAKAIQEAGFRVLMVDSNYEATRVARMAGVPAENANILSDYAAEELDLVGIRSLVAATPNDQVNALACINLGHSLGPSSVFQLKPADGDASNRISTSDDLGGRLFGLNAPSSEKILELEESGAVVKVTRLTEDFDFDAYRERYGESSCVLFTIGESRLDVAYPGSSQPSVGDTLVSLVVEPEG